MVVAHSLSLLTGNWQKSFVSWPKYRSDTSFITVIIKPQSVTGNHLFQEHILGNIESIIKKNLHASETRGNNFIQPSIIHTA